MLKITIITVCHNEKDRIKKTMESVHSQTYPNVEHLVIDGASSDGTVEVLEEYTTSRSAEDSLLDFPKVRFFSESDSGVYNAMNRGIARARGDYICFINAGDTLYRDTVIEDIVSYIIKDTDAIYYGRVCLLFADGLKRIQDYSEHGGTLKERLCQGYMPCHQAIFAPRKLLVDHYFREQFKIRADFEWLVYSVSKGNQCIGVPLTVSNYDAAGVSGQIKNAALLRQESRTVIEEYREYFVGKEKKYDFRQDGIGSKSSRPEAEQKYYRLFLLMNYWMSIRHKGVRIGIYLRRKGCAHIALYGIGSMGLRMLEELEGSGIKIDYAVDRNADRLCADLQVIKPGEAMEMVDMMIVTAVTDFQEIYSQLNGRVSFPIESLENILYEAGKEISL